MTLPPGETSDLSKKRDNRLPRKNFPALKLRGDERQPTFALASRFNRFHPEFLIPMARVLLILSIILSLATAGVGYIAKQKVDEVQLDLQKTKRNLRTETATLKKTREELATTEADLATTRTSLDDRTAELAKTKTELNDTATKLATATAEVEEKAKLLADVQAQLEGMRVTLGDIKPDEIAAKIAELNSMNVRLQSELNEAKQVQETLNARLQEESQKVVAKEQQVAAYKNVTVRAGTSGRVLAFNPGWNFAVLSIGDKAGLKSGVQMVVMRGTSMIAKVRVTTVEPNTSIADVLPGTIARGTTVQAGDTVIFEGSQR